MPLKFDNRDFLKRTNRIINRIDEDVAIPALQFAADKVIIEARKEVPVDTGKLRDSLGHEENVISNVPTSSLGSDVDYALPVHEILDKHHPNGKAKFLEHPLFRVGPRAIEEGVQREFKKL